MNIAYPSNTKTIIDEIRYVIGRDVDFYIPTLSGCNVCNLDPVTNVSTDSFCLVCSGEYWTKTYSIVTLSGHITWAPGDIMQWYPGGKVYDGDCRIQIEYTPENNTTVDEADYVVADNKELEIKRKTLRGFKPLNRVILDCIERDRKHD
jgi:hypothetical protein